MAAMPAIGVLVGAKISSRLAARLGTANLMRLCLWAGAVSIGLLALLPSYPIWLVLRLMIGVILTLCSSSAKAGSTNWWSSNGAGGWSRCMAAVMR
jgi:MFS family permease